MDSIARTAALARALGELDFLAVPPDIERFQWYRGWHSLHGIPLPIVFTESLVLETVRWKGMCHTALTPTEVASDTRTTEIAPQVTIRLHQDTRVIRVGWNEYLRKAVAWIL